MPEPGSYGRDEGSFGGTGQTGGYGGNDGGGDPGFSAWDLFSNPLGPLGYGLYQGAQHLFSGPGWSPEGGYDMSSREGQDAARQWRQGGGGRFPGARGGAPVTPQPFGGVHPITGEPLFPQTLDPAAATQAGVSPPAGPPIFGPGSPFTGPANIFGGV